MNWYSEHASEYIESTFITDMEPLLKSFSSKVKPGGKILDAGFGSGRDLVWFTKHGFDAYGIDITPEFVIHAHQLGLKAEKGNLEDYDPGFRFDGIWACASLVHLPPEKISTSISHLKSLLNPGGILFVSLKKGIGQAVDDKGRNFTYVDEAFFSRNGFTDIKANGDSLGRNTVWIEGFYRKGGK